jgi:hypothetical protein
MPMARGNGPGEEVIRLKTRQIGRDAKTGRIIPIKVAKARKATAIVQTVKVGRRKR